MLVHTYVYFRQWSVIQHPRKPDFHHFQFLVDVSVVCYFRVIYYVVSAPTKDLLLFPLIWTTIPIILDGSQWSDGYYLRIAEFLTFMFNKRNSIQIHRNITTDFMRQKENIRINRIRGLPRNTCDLLFRDNENTLRELGLLNVNNLRVQFNGFTFYLFQVSWKIREKRWKFWILSIQGMPSSLIHPRTIFMF